MFISQLKKKKKNFSSFDSTKCFSVSSICWIFFIHLTSIYRTTIYFHNHNTSTLYPSGEKPTVKTHMQHCARSLCSCPLGPPPSRSCSPESRHPGRKRLLPPRFSVAQSQISPARWSCSVWWDSGCSGGPAFPQRWLISRMSRQRCLRMRWFRKRPRKHSKAIQLFHECWKANKSY